MAENPQPGDQSPPPPDTQAPAQPAAKPPAEPAAKPPAEPAAKPPAEPAAKPPAEPAAKPPAEPAAKPPAESAAKPPAKPAVEPLAELPPAEPAADAVVVEASAPAGKLDQLKAKLGPVLEKLKAKKKLVGIVCGVVVVIGIGGGVFMFMGKSEPPPPPPPKPKPKPKPKKPAEKPVDLDKLKIPDQPLKGTLNGQPFSVTKAVFEAGTGVLSFQKRSEGSPDLEIKLSLPIKPEEEPAGKSFKKKRADGDAKPHASGFWKEASGSGGQAKLKKGYQLLLEFGEQKQGKIAGKLFLRFPKQHKTRVEGKFIAQVIQSKALAAAAAEKAAAEAKKNAMPKVSMAKLRKSCGNELGILCHGEGKSVWSALRCLKGNRSGLLKKCRKYLRSVKRLD